MRLSGIILMWACLGLPLAAQDETLGPSNEKAQKTYKHGLEYLHRHMTEAALDDFKKADKQDSGHCLACQKQMIKCGIEVGDWKAAETGATEIIAETQGQGQKDLAIAHYNLGMVLMGEATQKGSDDLFAHVHDEMSKALASDSNFANAMFSDGQALAHLGRYDASTAQFELFVKIMPTNDVDRRRALLFIRRPELARARMAPPFAVTTMDGRRISLDDLIGKVVLLDFWAVWCGPCREALPHVRDIAKKFQDQPLIILSVSLDDDDQKWKDFVNKNGMTWPQYRDGLFNGPIATLFGVQAIPHTFTIDADGVLQDEVIGDSSIEGKLKKLVSHARELQAQTPVR